MGRTPEDYLPEDYDCWDEEEKRKFLVDALVEGGQDVDELYELDTEDLEDMYNEYQQELEDAEYSMYPNGRDYDAEDFDD